MNTLAGWWKSSGETRRIKKKKIQKTPTILRLRPGTTKENKLRENSLPKTVKLRGQPLSHGASSSVDKESQKDTEATWDHYLHKSPNTSHFKEAVFSMVRKIYGKQPGDLMKDLNVNLAIWWMFMNTTLRAAIHFGKDFDTNLHYAKNHLWNSLGQIFLWNKKDWSVNSQKSKNTRDRWFENNWIWRNYMEIDKLIVRKSLSDHHC